MAQTSSRSELSKLPTNKTKRLYRLPGRFYGYQLFVLIVLAVLFTWLSRDETLDRWITGFWYDAAAQRFPLQQNPLLDLLNHRLAKYIAIALGAVALFYGAYKRNARLVTAALLMGLGALVVGVLKSVSHHSCPWDLVEYGGKAVSYPCSALPRQTVAPAAASRWTCLQWLYGHGPVFCLLARAPSSGMELRCAGRCVRPGNGLRPGHARGAFLLSQPVGWVVGLVFSGGGLRACFHPVC
jgi:membrane-associated PAP2 superfamily phosphatase